LQHGGFDYWESGMDLRMGADLYESFINYQTRLIAEYEKMAHEYNFQVIEAALPVEQIVAHLKQYIWPLLPQG
ncbi:MAG TPA: thymidylate kinase, partial [Ktedonobacteraceae bacterium]